MARPFEAILKIVQRGPRSHSFAALFSFATALCLHGAGCADSPSPSSSSTPGAGYKATVQAESSACTASSVGTTAKITFSTTLGCSEDDAARHGGTCPLEALTLNATSEANQTTGILTSSWTIAHGDTMVVAEKARSAHGSTSTEITFGPEFQGVHEAVFVEDGTTLNGRIDDRQIVAVQISKPRVVGGIEFADQKGFPEVRLSADIQDRIYRLLNQARADVPVACATSRSARPSPAVANLQTALPQVPLGSGGPTSMQRSVGGVLNLNPANVRVDAVTVAPQGVPTDFDGSNDQNNLLDFASPHCQSCQGSCVKNIFCELAPGCEQLCAAGCFIPVLGGCAEKPCLELGIGACDSNETCCGGTCCGPNAACGDSALSTCCPKADPVGCGDVTEVTCFAAGSQCCGNLPNACPPGSACTNVTATTASCCPPSQTTSAGACCARNTCNGQCCDSGTCLNGVCCIGAVANGVCCGGLETAVCNGQCCTGACTSNGSCCATTSGSVVCGSACCSSGQVCLNASASTCGAPTQPTLILISPTTGVVFGESGGPVVNVTNSESITVKGEAFDPGLVTLSVDTTSGTVIATSTAVGANGAATFTVPITTAAFSSGAHALVGWQTVGGSTLQAVVSLHVTLLQ
jgi:hypothetical protein